MRPSSRRVAGRWRQAAERLTIYRAHHGRPDLTNTNGADLDGMASFLAGVADGDTSAWTNAPYLSQFIVEVGGELGPYEYYRGGRPSNPQPGAPLVGVKPYGRGGQWYSFPKNGPWKVSRVKTVSMGEPRTTPRGTPGPGKPGVMYDEEGYERAVWWDGSLSQQVRWLKSFF